MMCTPNTFKNGTDVIWSCFLTIQVSPETVTESEHRNLNKYNSAPQNKTSIG